MKEELKNILCSIDFHYKENLTIEKAYWLKDMHSRLDKINLDMPLDDFSNNWWYIKEYISSTYALLDDCINSDDYTKLLKLVVNFDEELNAYLFIYNKPAWNILEEEYRK